jgi:1,4-dihydroxy-2-naphthoate octaprenyltransferase
MEVQTFGAHFIEVEVDVTTGQVQVLRAVCAHDLWRWINPLLCVFATYKYTVGPVPSLYVSLVIGRAQ